jgi:hypothetical protein
MALPTGRPESSKWRASCGPDRTCRRCRLDRPYRGLTDRSRLLAIFRPEQVAEDGE